MERIPLLLISALCVVAIACGSNPASRGATETSTTSPSVQPAATTPGRTTVITPTIESITTPTSSPSPPVASGFALAFDRVVQNAPAGTEPAAARIIVARDPDTLAEMAALLAEGDVAAVTTAAGEGVPVGVFLGARGSSGHRITIERLDLVGRDLVVAVRIGMPAPDEPVLHVFTSPYEVAMIAEVDAARLSGCWSIVASDGGPIGSGC